MLEIKDLSVAGRGGVPLLDRVSFTLKPGGCIGLTGASGAGKTTLIKAVMGILDQTCRIISGDILLDGVSLASLEPAKRRALCGTTLGFIPQNPMTAFDRHRRIGRQMNETFRLRLGISREEADRLARKKLAEVNLPDPGRVMNAWPSQLSGGMLQRVAMALLHGMNPRYILADEPTSALDEANRDLLVRSLAAGRKDAGILFLSHDAAAIRALCPQILVMERGRLVTNADTEELFAHPATPWAERFAASIAAEKGDDWQWTEL